MKYHETVLLKESVDAMQVSEGGVYVDVTFGGGGHSKELLSRVEDCSLYGFDQDTDALRNELSDDRLVLINENFATMNESLVLFQVSEVDGILADLGVSGHQFDDEKRGFSIRGDEVLDMRMNQEQGETAKAYLARVEKEDLAKVLKEYGEVKRPGLVADGIKYWQSQGKMETTGDLVKAVKKFSERGKENRFLAQVFQAIRIEVNQEMDVLKAFLQQSAELLKVGGRLVVITYHSLEDRLVKNFMKSGSFDGQMETDLFGVPNAPLKMITRKPILPSKEELELNNRARSAKLRIAERVK